jgi:hypothetical protein
MGNLVCVLVIAMGFKRAKRMVYIPVMSSEDLYGVLSAIIEHSSWKLQGVRKAKN